MPVINTKIVSSFSFSAKDLILCFIFLSIMLVKEYKDSINPVLIDDSGCETFFDDEAGFKASEQGNAKQHKQQIPLVQTISFREKSMESTKYMSKGKSVIAIHYLHEQVLLN